MYIDATVGIKKYSITFRADLFWFWHPWHTWTNPDEKCFSASLGLFEIEVRVPKRGYSKPKD